MEDKNEMLQYGYNYCNENDKSTEFMLQFMQDVAGATLDEVLEFLENI